MSCRDSSPWKPVGVTKWSSRVIGRKWSEWLKLFQSCFLEMGQGQESRKPANRDGFNASSFLATSSQQLQEKFAGFLNSSKEEQRLCHKKPTGTCTDTPELSTPPHLCILESTVSCETSPCTGWSRASWITCCAPSHSLASYPSLFCFSFNERIYFNAI